MLAQEMKSILLIDIIATDKTAIDDQVCFPDSQILAQTNVQ